VYHGAKYLASHTKHIKSRALISSKIAVCHILRPWNFLPDEIGKEI